MVGINPRSISGAGHANNCIPCTSTSSCYYSSFQSFLYRSRIRWCRLAWGSLISLLIVLPWFCDISGVVQQSSPNNYADAPSRPVSCRYHGNCPEGTACSTGGLCLPYYFSRSAAQTGTGGAGAGAGAALLSSNDEAHGNCVRTCLQELIIEDGFQYGAIPMVQWTSVAKLPHAGCVINFRRQRRQGNWSDRPSMAYRIAQRWRSVTRIDAGSQDDHWVALCNLPCLTDSDCPNSLACLGRRDYQPSPEEPKWTFTKHCLPRTGLQSDMVVVSGADDGYFEPLENLAASLRYWAPARKLVIYNLGMTVDQLNSVKSWPNVIAIHWNDGFPSSFPPHVADDIHNFAWKSLIINETVHEYKSIFWLDAGATFVGPIEPIEEIVHLHGMFLVKGQDEDMRGLSDPATYRWHGYDKKTYPVGPHFAGGIQGHVFPSRYIDTVVIPNAECALDPDCISPTSASLLTHRFDQTSLSILAYQPRVRAPSYTEFLAGSPDQLHMHGNNLSVASNRFIMWTARGACQFYSMYHGFSDEWS